MGINAFLIKCRQRERKKKDSSSIAGKRTCNAKAQCVKTTISIEASADSHTAAVAVAVDMRILDLGAVVGHVVEVGNSPFSSQPACVPDLLEAAATVYYGSVELDEGNDLHGRLSEGVIEALVVGAVHRDLVAEDWALGDSSWGGLVAGAGTSSVALVQPGCPCKDYKTPPKRHPTVDHLRLAARVCP